MTCKREQEAFRAPIKKSRGTFYKFSKKINKKHENVIDNAHILCYNDITS